jgi:ACS family hexuronate transporter-like MFS transporter
MDGRQEPNLEDGPMDNSKTSYRWIIVGVLWLIHALVFMNFSGLGILAPFIKEEFGLSSFQIGFLISSLSVGAALGQIPAGLIVDFTGVRRMLTLSIGALGLFLALFSQAPTFPIALAILLLHGLANGIISPAASKSILDWFPDRGRATAMGIKQTGVNFGGIFAGLLLPTLAILFTWRQSLLAVGLVEMAAMILVYGLLKESPTRSDGPRKALAWRKILQMAMRRDMLILSGIGFCFMACQFCFSTYLILFLTREMQHPILQAGQYYALSFFVGAAGRILWSLGSDYLLAGRRRGTLFAIAAILFLSSLTLGMISFFPPLSPLLTIAIFAFGISGIGWNAVYLTIVGEAVNKESTGLATGICYFFGFLGSLTGPPIFGLLVDRSDAYGYAWLLLALCAGMILILLGFYREKKTTIRAESVGRQESNQVS